MNDSEGNKMRDQFSNAQQVRKPAAISRGGIVVAQSRKAAEIGAEVLAAGGDCVDAVVATSFALGVLEPWNSGIGGGGAMVLYRAREDRYEVIDFGMRSPAGIRAKDYALTGEGAASDLFPWPRVKDDRNLYGPGSIAVPGVVAGIGVFLATNNALAASFVLTKTRRDALAGRNVEPQSDMVRKPEQGRHQGRSGSRSAWLLPPSRRLR